MRLTKHHGLGNDFLVLLDEAGTMPVTPDRARALCDRRRGVGADGLIRATRPPRAPAGGGDRDGDGASGAGDVDAVMELINADGSAAEMSGNGIRCLAQALLDAGWVTGTRASIATAAGLRVVTDHGAVAPAVDGGLDGATRELSVDMGPARLLGDAPEWVEGPLTRAMLVDMGNPHLVVERPAPPGDDPGGPGGPEVSLVELGERVNVKVDGGANVHLLTPGAGGGIAIRTYERGVGPTEACGTGACASAAAARAWGLAGDEVLVAMPGGTAQVRLAETVVLRGPAAMIATIEVA